MKLSFYFPIAVFVILHVSECLIATEKQLFRHIVDKSGFKSTRPVRNSSHAIEIRLGLALVYIGDVDEKNQVITCNVWFVQVWTDEQLSWNVSETENIRSIRLPSEYIWTPDIRLHNSAVDDTMSAVRAMIDSDGVVFWSPPAQVKVMCHIDITYYPFDEHICHLLFGSNSYTEEELYVTNDSTTIDLANYVPNGEFELKDVDVVRRESCLLHTNASCVVFTIHIRRRPLFFTVNVIVPSILVTGLTVVVFRIPPGAGQKIWLGIALLFYASVSFFTIAEKVPGNYDTTCPLIAGFLISSLGANTLCIIFTVIVLRIRINADIEVPHWLKKLTTVEGSKWFGIRVPKRAVSVKPLPTSVVESSACCLARAYSVCKRETCLDEVTYRRCMKLLRIVRALAANTDNMDTARRELEWTAVMLFADQILFYFFVAIWTAIIVTFLTTRPDIYIERLGPN